MQPINFTQTAIEAAFAAQGVSPAIIAAALARLAAKTAKTAKTAKRGAEDAAEPALKFKWYKPPYAGFSAFRMDRASWRAGFTAGKAGEPCDAPAKAGAKRQSYRRGHATGRAALCKFNTLKGGAHNAGYTRMREGEVRIDPRTLRGGDSRAHLDAALAAATARGWRHHPRDICELQKTEVTYAACGEG